MQGLRLCSFSAPQGPAGPPGVKVSERTPPPPPARRLAVHWAVCELRKTLAGTTITHRPSRASVLGGTVLKLSGPCLHASDLGRQRNLPPATLPRLWGSGVAPRDSSHLPALLSAPEPCPWRTPAPTPPRRWLGGGAPRRPPWARHAPTDTWVRGRAGSTEGCFRKFL